MASTRICSFCDAITMVREGKVCETNCRHQSKGQDTKKLLPRLSSPKDPKEWIYTEDGYAFEVGDRLFNYYDNKWGQVMTEPDDQGWFSFKEDDGQIKLLNGVRLSKNLPK